jgi:hypothetical protein
MSSPEVAVPAPAVSRGGSGTLQLLGNELSTQFRRWRTWAMLAALALIPILIGIAIRLVAQGTLDDFRRAGARTRIQVRTPDLDVARTVLAGLGIEADARDAASDLDVVTGVMSDDAAPEAIVAALVAGGVRVCGFEVVGESLEQRFVELTGEGFDVVA